MIHIIYIRRFSSYKNAKIFLLDRHHWKFSLEHSILSSVTVTVSGYIYIFGVRAFKFAHKSFATIYYIAINYRHVYKSIKKYNGKRRVFLLQLI